MERRLSRSVRNERKICVFMHSLGSFTRSVGFSGEVMHLQKHRDRVESSKIDVPVPSSKSGEELEAWAAGVRGVSEAMEDLHHKLRDKSAFEVFEKRVASVVIAKVICPERGVRATVVVTYEEETIKESHAVSS
jgi:hypothetical protein